MRRPTRARGILFTLAPTLKTSQGPPSISTMCVNGVPKSKTTKKLPFWSKMHPNHMKVRTFTVPTSTSGLHLKVII